MEELRGGFATSDDVRIEPLWNEHSGPPKVRGFRAMAPGSDVSMEFPLTYFSPCAERVACERVRRGELETGDLYEYSVLAEPRRTEPAPRRRAITIETTSPALSITPAALQPLMNRSLLMGSDHARDVPAFIHWNVLEECSLLTRRAGAMETGGVLMGRIHRDDAGGDLFLDVTAQVPAAAEGELTRLSFTADTWNQMQCEINRRCTTEIWLGWWHSHSFTKAQRPEISSLSTPRRERSIATAFLSEEDLLLQRTVFPRAYSLALLVTDSPMSGMSWSVFGWRRGAIKPRGFHLLDVPLPSEFTTLGENHATNLTASGTTDPDCSTAAAGVAG